MQKKNVSIFKYIEKSILLNTLDDIAKATGLPVFLIEPGVEMPLFSHYTGYPPLCSLIKLKTDHQCSNCPNFIRRMVHSSVKDRKIYTCPLGMKFVASPIAAGHGAARAVIICGFARFDDFENDDFATLFKVLSGFRIDNDEVQESLNNIPLISEDRLFSIGDYLSHACITIMKHHMISTGRPSGSVEHEMAMLRKQVETLSQNNRKRRPILPVTMKDEKQLIEAIISRNRSLAYERSQKLLERLFYGQEDLKLLKYWVMELGVVICNAPLFKNDTGSLSHMELNHLVDIPAREDLSLTGVQLWFNKLIERVMDQIEEAEDCDITSPVYRVRHVIQYINRNTANKIKIADIAEYACISQQHLNRLFSKEVGISLGKYLNNMKLEEGKKLLMNSGLNVAQIAEKLDFYDVAHFSRKFKELFNLSPAKYRQEIRTHNQENH